MNLWGQLFNCYGQLVNLCIYCAFHMLMEGATHYFLPPMRQPRATRVSVVSVVDSQENSRGWYT